MKETEVSLSGLLEGDREALLSALSLSETPERAERSAEQELDLLLLGQDVAAQSGMNVRAMQLVLILLLLLLPGFLGIDGVLLAGPAADLLVAIAAFFVIRAAFRRLDAEAAALGASDTPAAG